MIRYSPYLLPLTLQDSRATFLAANLLPASDPPRLLSTFRLKFLNMASKFFPDLTPSTLQPPLSFLSLPCLLPKPFPLPGCQTLCHEGSCLVTAWPMYSLLLLPGLPSFCPLSHINVYYFSGLSLNVTARNPSLTSPIPRWVLCTLLATLPITEPISALVHLFEFYWLVSSNRNTT